MELASLAPEAKVAGAVALAAAILAVPAASWPLFVLVATLLTFLLVAARVTLRWVATRLVVLVPFGVLALVLPFVALGERRDMGPVEVSVPGMVAGALFATRCALALGVALVLVATTSAADLTEGLARLRVPAALVLVLTTMVRYLGVVGGDLHRMTVARASRGDGRGRAGQWMAAAAGVGRLFVRSYERAERVHLAMLARGWDGTPMRGVGVGAPLWQWVACLAPGVVVGLLVWGGR